MKCAWVIKCDSELHIVFKTVNCASELYQQRNKIKIVNKNVNKFLIVVNRLKSCNCA